MICPLNKARTACSELPSFANPQIQPLLKLTNKANEREMYNVPTSDRKKCLYEYCLLNKNGAGNKNNDAHNLATNLFSLLN